MSAESSLQLLLENQFAKKGYHVLTALTAAPVGLYTGIIALEIDTEIASITGVDTTKITGTNNFAGVKIPNWGFLPVPGNFTTLTLAAGKALLLK